MRNDLSDAEQGYFNEYQEAGGAEHAAYSYAKACALRDGYAATVAKYALGDKTPDRDDETAAMRTAERMYATTSATAERLRAALPDAEGELPNAGGHFAEGM